MSIDTRRRRLGWRVLAGGAGAGALAAGASAAVGLSGRFGFVVAALLTALGAVTGALLSTLLAIVDEARGEKVSRARVAQILFLYALAALTVIGLGALAGGPG
jgi:hypothetical protein